MTQKVELKHKAIPPRKILRLMYREFLSGERKAGRSDNVKYSQFVKDYKKYVEMHNAKVDKEVGANHD